MKFSITFSILFIFLLTASSSLSSSLIFTSSSTDSSTASNYQPSIQTESNGSTLFQTNNVAVTFNTANSTGGIERVEDLLTNQTMNLDGNYPLWSIATINPTSLVTSVGLQDYSYFVRSDELVMFWAVPKPALEISVQVSEDPSDGGIHMSINVSNYSQNTTIYQVRFPILDGFSSFRNNLPDSLAVPRLDGIVIPDMQQDLKGVSLEMNYPGTLSMQFALVYDNFIGGMYYATQDPGSNFKALEVVDNNLTNSSFRLDWINYPPQISPGNQFPMNYTITLAGFSGQSWEDGALLYKSWATKQWYVERGPLTTRSDIPEWFKNIGLLWKINPPDQQMPSIMSTLNQEFPNETKLLDLWGWNNGGFDRNYPDYFPALDGNANLTNAISQTHQEGGKALLFFSGRLVDSNTTFFQNYKQYMIVGSNGLLHFENFSSGLNAAVPDPSTSFWRSEVINYTTEGIRMYNADGVYLDSVARAPPILNYANATHPTLSGSEWWQSWASIISGVRSSIREVNPNAIVTSEGVSEVYIPFLDGFWDNMDQDNATVAPGAVQAPMFSFIYHQYALVYGSPLSYLQSQSWMYELSKTAAFGLIIRPDIPSYLSYLVFKNDTMYLANLTASQQQYASYFRFGDEVPAPLFTQISENMTIPFSSTHSLTFPTVSDNMYESSNGSTIIFLTNPTSSSQWINLRFYSGEFESNSILQSVKLCQIGGQNVGSGCISSNGGDNDVNVTINPLSSLILQVKATLLPVSQQNQTSTQRSINNVKGIGLSALDTDLTIILFLAVGTVALTVIRYNKRKARCGHNHN